MKHVVLLSGEHEAPAPALLDALGAAGFFAVAVPAAAVAPPSVAASGLDMHEAAPSPVAVLVEVSCASEPAVVHDSAARAASAWPDVPLVACRRAEVSANGNGAATRHGGPDTPALERMGFAAVADDPAQLPALLRDLEERGVAGEMRMAEAAGTDASGASDENFLTQSSLLLPERLSVRRLRAAFETVASLHFSNDQKSAASAALVGLAALVEADRWTIYLAGEVRSNSEEAALEPLAARGLTPSEREIPSEDWRRALMGDALALTGAESRAARAAVVRAEAVRSREARRRVVAVPLVAPERVIGVVEGVREGAEARPFSQPDVELLSALALPLTAALTNAVRIAEAERLSQTDDLTKLHNARFLRQYLIGEIKRARRYGSSVSAMFLDLDDFKSVNDHYGHLVGSHVLMETAAVILASVRDTDVVARYGGDEFVVILPETGMERAAGVAERVRERLARHTFNGGRGLSLTLTASFGVSNFPQHAQSPQQLIAAADTAMYEAKAARKNCVRHAAEATP
ncbi:MAG TPA: GGDEF domain-containing protein [Pyrinomonadaceae bacterium]|nr:GGDEF domain-containing protein [Pyrinomonadaceae bacterium]